MKQEVGQPWTQHTKQF